MKAGAVIPGSLRLRIGQEYELRLRGHGLSGYVWTAQSDRECVAVTRTREVGATGAIGGNLDEIVVIRALAAGTATVRLEERRPWMSADEPLDSATVHVTIADDA